MSFACSLNLNRPDCSDLPWHVGFGEKEMPSRVLSESQPAYRFVVADTRSSTALRRGWRRGATTPPSAICGGRLGAGRGMIRSRSPGTARRASAEGRFVGMECYTDF